MNPLLMLLAAVCLLAPLVAIHEFGHFAVARFFKVKVLVFSIGFGPVLYKHIGKKNGVQYQFALIPLGGYVKMADEREGEVPEADIPYAFNRQSAWVRLAIVSAGPLINLLFAFFLFWVLALPAKEALNTRVNTVDSTSVAYTAGVRQNDLITHVDQKSTQTAEEMNYALIDRMGETGSVTLHLNRNNTPYYANLPIVNFLNQGDKNPFDTLGFHPYFPKLEPVLAEVVKGESADLQGLKVGDRILKLNGTPIKDWLDAVKIIHVNPEKNVVFTILRGKETLTVNVMPQGRMERKKMVGYIGAGIKPPQKNIPATYKQTVNLNPLEAIPYAWDKTVAMCELTVTSIVKMMKGLIGIENISGPITIAKVAGQTASYGWEAFIGFMAMMSISLGIMNLIPIPVLDGGHIVYYIAEIIRGKPLPENIQQFGLKVGVVLLGVLMVVALFNDVTQLL